MARAAGAAPLGRAALVASALAGALALASEVLWTRALQVLVGNSAYAFATILVVYLVGVALGSAAFAGVVKRSRRLEVWMLALLLGMGVWTIVAAGAFELLQSRFAGTSQQPITAGAMLLLYAQGAALLLPLAVLSGALFPVATRLLEPDAPDAGGEGVARVYGWNTIGAVAGSVLAGFVVAVHFDSLQAVHVVAAGYALAALGVGALVVPSSGRRAATAACLLLALALAGYGVAEARGTSRFVSALERTRPGLEVTFHRPGLQGVTTVIRREGEPYASLLLVNAQGMTAKLTDTKMMAHLPLLVHPKPEDTLVICFGMGTTFRAALSHGGKVTAVELVPEVLEAFDQFFADADQVRRNPNGRLIANDGRNFLKLTRERFDVITVDPPPPIDAAGVTHLYSQEFVALARERLAPGGLFAHWLPFPGTGSGIESAQTFRMLLKTITVEFPHVLVAQAINGVGLHVLASSEPIEIDREAIARRLADPAVAADLNEWQPVPLAFFDRLEPPSELDFVLQRGPRTVRIRGNGLDAVPPLTDDRPRLEFDLWWSLRHGQPKYQPSIWAG
ncbi:MAG TPA: hypothetical protein VLC53_18870, partial [Myxococcota bacterium]|nr:hypothetical protein [Myxococcota bacterium]